MQKVGDRNIRDILQSENDVHGKKKRDRFTVNLERLL